MFDKADEAQSLEDLRQVYEKLKKKQETLKNGDDKALKANLGKEIRRVTQEIEQREEQKKEE